MPETFRASIGGYSIIKADTTISLTDRNSGGNDISVNAILSTAMGTPQAGNDSPQRVILTLFYRRLAPYTLAFPA